MLGPPLIQCYLMIHFGADLRALTSDRPAVLHFVLDPEVGGAFIAHDVESDWVFMHPIDPTRESVEDYDDARCLDIIDRAAGTRSALRSWARAWWMSSQTAESMGGGRIFLVGDAAHRFPPDRWSRSELWGPGHPRIDVAPRRSFEWPLVGRSARLVRNRTHSGCPNNAHQSLTNALKMVHLSAALGTDVEPTTEQLHASLTDPSKADVIAAAVEMQREHFDLIGLQLGYVYGDGALVAEESPPEPESPSTYVPTARPGPRRPTPGSARSAARRRSISSPSTDPCSSVSGSTTSGPTRSAPTMSRRCESASTRPRSTRGRRCATSATVARFWCAPITTWRGGLVTPRNRRHSDPRSTR